MWGAVAVCDGHRRRRSLEPVARHDRLLDEVAEVLERELAPAALARRREGHGLELALEVLVELGLDFVEPVAPAGDPAKC